MQCGSSAATFQKWGGFSIYAAGPAADLLKSGTIFSLKMFQDGEHMFVFRRARWFN